MKLIPQEGLWSIVILPDRQGEEREENSKVAVKSKITGTVIPFSMLSCALGITNVRVPALCIDCVFKLCVWLVNMQSTSNQVIQEHGAVIPLTGSQV